MRAGPLRHRVTVLTATTTTNSFNEPAQSWPATGVTVWGDMRPLMARAREQLAERAGQMAAVAPYQCRMRYGVTPVSAQGSRLVWRGRTFEVESVNDPDGRGAEWVVLCWEVQG